MENTYIKLMKLHTYLLVPYPLYPFSRMFRPSGLPWTSKNVPLEAKAFVKIKPLAIQSQKGYKVKTRSVFNMQQLMSTSSFY